MKIIYVIVLFLSFGCNSDDDNVDSCIDESKINLNAVCIEIYDPVCGCDDKTYPNSCYAESAGVISFTNGECNG